jgi:steroid 5-alpha reductase family enzyme
MDSNVWLAGFVASVMLFQVVAIPGLIFRRNDYADVLWGPAFTIAGLLAAAFGLQGGLAALDLRSILVLGLVGIWSVRLFLHVGVRNLSHSTEDVRYNNWRKQWGSNWLWRSYLQVFVLQALILYLFLTPVLHSIASTPIPLSWLAWLGVAVWVSGFLFESIADEQLRRFKAQPQNKGKLMTVGVWSWSRHPNYFGEVVQWWGIWIMVVDLPYGWATVLSPLGVTFLILKVSGVSMLEDLMRSRQGFSEYAQRTSIFFPWPPKVK